MVFIEEKEKYQDDIALIVEEEKEKGNVVVEITIDDEFYGVFRLPDKPIIRKANEKKSDGDDAIIRACIVFPSYEEWQKKLKQFAGLEQDVVREIFKEAKFEAKATSKRL
jgi:hypothetical protein